MLLQNMCHTITENKYVGLIYSVTQRITTGLSTHPYNANDSAMDLVHIKSSSTGLKTFKLSEKPPINIISFKILMWS